MAEDTKRMDDDDLVTALKADVQDAVSFIDSDIAPYRAQATNFYHGRPFGDEEDGRSQVVMPVVRDTVRAMLPGLMRLFFGGTRVCEIIGMTRRASEQQDEMNDAVEYVLTRQNPGFRILWDAFKDGLTRKVGFVCWWWDDSTCVKGRTYDNVSDEQLEAAYATLKGNEELEVVSAEEVGPAGPNGEPAIYSYKIRITTRERYGKVKVEAFPPEEFIIDRWARCKDSARLVGRRTLKTRGDLVAAGVSPDLLDDVGSAQGGQFGLETNQELLARQPSSMQWGVTSETEDQEKILYCDLYYRVDFDGDGISELRRVVTVGDDFKIVSNDYADEVQIAGFCPDPEPHVVFGLSIYDNLADMQLIESHVTRDVLDSLKASIFPRTAYVEGQVNVDDVLNTEIGAAIRMRQPGMLQTLEVPFVGQQALPVLEYLDQIKERRTGVRGSSPMLDAKALQSTNQVAVNAAVTGAQAQVELVARIFAETGMKNLVRGILKLLVENQQVPLRIIKDGNVIEVSPKDWDIDVEVEVNSGLGTGQNEAKTATLQAVVQSQHALLTEMGPENPIVSVEHLYNTQAELLRLNGFRDVHKYWRDPKTYQAPEPTPPEPTPEEVIAGAQMEIEAGKLDLEQLKAILDDDFKRDELDAEIALKAAELNARYKTQVDVAALKALMERARFSHERQVNEDKAIFEAAKPQSVAGGEKDGPRRKILKRAVRDETGRIQAVEETEQFQPRKVIKRAVRDESGRIVAVDEQQVE